MTKVKKIKQESTVDLLIEKLHASKACFRATAEGKASTAKEFARVIRLSIKTLRHRQKMTAVALKDVYNEVLALFRLLPRQSMVVGSNSIYQLNDGSTICRRSFLDKGGYNVLFRSEWTLSDEATPEYTVLRFLKHFDEEETLRVTIAAFVEICLNILLTNTGAVVPIICPLKVERSTEPGYDFGMLLPNITIRGATLYDVMTKKMKHLTNDWCFDIFALIVKRIEELQKEFKFIHRDLKSDNIVLERIDDTKDYASDNVKIKFIDLGLSELCLANGERLGCDVEDFLILHPPRFNDSIDFVYLAFTLLEDDGPILLKHRCHRFVDFINQLADSVLTVVVEMEPKYHMHSEDTRNELFLKSIYKTVKHGSYSPTKVIDMIASMRDT